MKYALLFPGQGSQALGMLGGLSEPEVAATFAEASSVLGWDLAKLIHDGPAEALNRTECTQPALLAAGIAVFRVWQKQPGLPAPAAMAGHSLGEYTALVAGGSIAFADALRLVELRGQFMQAAVPQGSGGMAAVIGMEDAAVEKLCAANPTGAVLEPVNYNAPGQVVVAGETAALDWLAANAKAAGARMVMRLPVSVPSHCSLMRDAASKLSERLASLNLRAPDVPVHHNLDARPSPTEDGIRLALREQLYKPVRWAATIQNLAQDGVEAFFECGPGRILTGLTRRIVPQTKFIAMEDSAGLAHAAQLARV